MALYVDLHIHSALSPCGHEDMTPNNIINMAKLKGLDAIAITDHNSCENLPAFIEVGKKNDMIVIPGIELQTREDIHVLCLFGQLENALIFQDFVFKHLPNIENKEKIFGEQLIFDEEDNIIRKNKNLLLTSANISFDDAFYKVKELNGAFIPAHIDKETYSVISSLGFIPGYLDINTLEYFSIDGLNKLKKNNLILKRYNFIQSSDAHFLEDILERNFILQTSEKSISGILSALS